MSDGFSAALVAASVALLGVLLSQFVAERYRRFQDGSALAAGLLGELKSYSEAWPVIDQQLSAYIDQSQKGSVELLKRLRPFPRPSDLFFDEAVSKLGLLGPRLVEDVVFVYSNIRAFRMGFEIVAREHSAMDAEEVERRCTLCRDALRKATNRGKNLEKLLETRASAWFLL